MPACALSGGAAQIARGQASTQSADTHKVRGRDATPTRLSCWILMVDSVSTARPDCVITQEDDEPAVG